MNILQTITAATALLILCNSHVLNIVKSPDLIGSWSNFETVSTASDGDKKMMIAWKKDVEEETTKKFAIFEPELYKTEVVGTNWTVIYKIGTTAKLEVKLIQELQGTPRPITVNVVSQFGELTAAEAE